MTKTITAHTNPDPVYPGYVNIGRSEDGDVVLTVRGDPTTSDGVYVCGYPRDKGQPGRCTPGDDRCNNYCNMAPHKGPMQPRPQGCKQTYAGNTVTLKLSAEAFANLVSELERADA